MPEGMTLSQHAPRGGTRRHPGDDDRGVAFDRDAATRTLLDQMRTPSLDGFGLSADAPAVQAAGALVAYLRDTQKADLAHVRTITLRQQATAARRSDHHQAPRGRRRRRRGTRRVAARRARRTMTSMGGRLLRTWLLRPLVAIEPIRDRLDAVEELAFRGVERAKFRDALKAVQDMERLVARAALGSRRTARSRRRLKSSLAAVPACAACCSPNSGAAHRQPERGAGRRARDARTRSRRRCSTSLRRWRGMAA